MAKEGLSLYTFAIDKIAVIETDFASALAELQMLFAYAVVIITAGILLFDFVWND